MTGENSDVGHVHNFEFEMSGGGVDTCASEAVVGTPHIFIDLQVRPGTQHVRTIICSQRLVVIGAL